MTEQKQAELTLGERRYLERVREAQSEGVTLKDYYLAHGLSLRMLCRVQRQLTDKGIVPPFLWILRSEEVRLIRGP